MTTVLTPPPPSPTAGHPLRLTNLKARSKSSSRHGRDEAALAVNDLGEISSVAALDTDNRLYSGTL